MKHSRLVRGFSGYGNRQRMERIQTPPTSYVIQESAVEQVQQSPSAQFKTGIRLIGSATKGIIKNAFANKDGS